MLYEVRSENEGAAFCLQIHVTKVVLTKTTVQRPKQNDNDNNNDNSLWRKEKHPAKYQTKAKKTN